MFVGFSLAAISIAVCPKQIGLLQVSIPGFAGSYSSSTKRLMIARMSSCHSARNLLSLPFVFFHCPSLNSSLCIYGSIIDPCGWCSQGNHSDACGHQRGCGGTTGSVDARCGEHGDWRERACATRYPSYNGSPCYIAGIRMPSARVIPLGHRAFAITGGTDNR